MQTQTETGSSPSKGTSKKLIRVRTVLNSAYNIDVTPDKSLIKKLGRTGYRTEQAIAELIDNSIDARIKEKAERVDVRLDFDKRQITITDNGQGMNDDELKRALTIAKETKREGQSLGQFGLGMKSACSTLGKSFKLTTTKPDSKTVLTAEYDEDQWLGDESKNWTNFEIKKTDKKTDWHGTVITIGKLKVPLYPNQLSNFRKSFGIRYGPYLKDRQIRIRVNSKDCRAARPDLQKGTRKKISIRLPSGSTITGWIGLLERRSVKGDYGIHLYRRGRLIRAFDKFGIRHHPEVARIIGEISLDHVPVNFHKTGFLEDSLEYMEATAGFRRDPTVMQTLRSSSSQRGDAAEIRSVLEYEHGTIPERPIDTRISAAGAKSLLRKAGSLTIRRGGLKMNMEFSDMAGGIYNTGSPDDGLDVTVNRSSHAFGAFKNPLFLLGMIRIEAELAADNPAKYAGFIDERNKRWDEFVRKFMPNPAKKDRSETIVPIPNYSLEDELIELHDHLRESFEHDFQFTGLSTLAPFLHNAYNRIIYTIQTVNGAGQELLESVTDYTTRFTAMLNPRPIEVETALGLTRDRRFLIIREYAERLPASWAAPEKAWLDLYFEVKKGGIMMYHDELTTIMDDLLEGGLASPAKLRSLARRRKVLGAIERYLGGE